MRDPAVFLDRDGTLIHDTGYIAKVEDVRILDGVIEGLAAIRSFGFKLVVVTNQSGIGRGLFDLEAVDRIHEEISRRLWSEAGIEISGFYVSPHVEAHSDRKPSPGMLFRAARDLELDLFESWMIGDKLTDMSAGKSAGCRTILLESGEPDASAWNWTDFSCPDMLVAAEFVRRFSSKDLSD
jgi:histidinol-phosphate phosphatase family protein